MTIKELLSQYDTELKIAFLDAIKEITSKIQISQIVERLEKGDINGAIEVLYLDSAAFDRFENSINAAYSDGGKAAIADVSPLKDVDGNKFIVRFNARNLRAERFIKEHSSNLITRIVKEQREVIKKHLVKGMEQGKNPRSVALDLVGRINRQTRRREGGIIGLSGPQSKALTAATDELKAGAYKEYLTRQARDKRFDKTILKAIKDDKPLTADQIGRITNRYADTLLKLRGDTIARTEALTSLHAGQFEAMQQVVDTGKVKENQVRRVWDASGDARVRNSHRAVDGQMVGLKEDFVMPSGARLRYAGDPKGGAAEVINCRCLIRTRIDFLANVN